MDILYVIMNVSSYRYINLEQVGITVFNEDLFYHMISKLHCHLRFHDRILERSAHCAE